jgi:hypothetical protein
MFSVSYSWPFDWARCSFLYVVRHEKRLWGGNAALAIIPLLLFVVMAVSPTQTFAQLCDTCATTLPDCTSDLWEGPDTTTFGVCVGINTCTITVTYCHRRACDTYNDISIRCITYDPDCVGSSLTWQQLVDAAVQAAVRHRVELNDPNYNGIPQCPSTSTVFRVINSPCFSSMTIGGVRYVRPCTGTGACFMTYSMCWDLCPKFPCDDTLQEECVKTTRQSTWGTGSCPYGCFEFCQ